MCMNGCTCVYVREREKGRERERDNGVGNLASVNARELKGKVTVRYRLCSDQVPLLLCFYDSAMRVCVRMCV